MVDLNKYSFLEIISLVIAVIRTKFLFREARLIRFPFDIRGRRFIRVSKGFTTGRGCRIEAYPEDKKTVTLNIGNNVQINDYVHITAMVGVTIGDNVLLASKIYISDCTHGSYAGTSNDSSPLTPPSEREYSMKCVIIENNVWIGESVSILPGVVIGEGAIIGSNSVVTKDIPANTIAVGVPAKVIKKYNFEIKKWESV